jgi:hypothetical protein
LFLKGFFGLKILNNADKKTKIRELKHVFRYKNCIFKKEKELLKVIVF